MIGFCSSAVLLVAEQAGSGGRAAAHLINAELTGHAAAAAAADSRLPAAPAATGEKKKLQPCHNTTSKRFLNFLCN